jgi:signal transduction histidine kinase
MPTESRTMVYRFGNPYSLALFVVAASSFALAAVVARHRSRRMGRPLAVFLLGEGLWALGDAMRIAAPTEAAVLLWNDVAYLGVVTILPAYVLFFAAYASRDWWFRRRNVAGLVAISALAYLTIVTNDVHHLWLASVDLSPGTAPPVLDETWGPAWYVWAVYVYGLVLLGAYYALEEFVAAYRSGTHAVRAGLVLLAILVPIVGNVLFILEVVPFDPITYSFGFTGVVFSVAILRYRLLGVGTVARDVVVENLDSGVLVLDPADTVVDANEEAVAVLETEREALLGSYLWDVLPAFEGSVEWLQDARDHRGTVTVETVDGPRHFDVDVSPLSDDFGTALGRVVVFTDVTDRVRREQTLRERSEELARQNDRLEQFAEVVSHDLRNPMHVARGYIDVAESDDEDLATAADALDRMEAIVEDVLTLARAGETIDDDDLERVDVAGLAEDAWANLEAGDATLVVEDGADPVDGDRERLLHVFENLFRNAVDHNDGPVTVTVGPLDGGFYVADDGTGVPPGDKGDVFDHGYTTREDGTGFGLSIVADVVDAHGWDVDLADSEDGGARFEVSTG